MTTALARLMQLITPPSEPRFTDWATVENQLGLTLPADYKELIRIYGGSRWDDYLTLLEPGCPNDNYDLIEWKNEKDEVMEDLWRYEEKPEELADGLSRVIPWADTDNGECVYWLARPGVNPDEWTVMVNEARGPYWEHHSMNCTEFLLRTLTGEVECKVFSETFYPLPVHQFERLYAV